MERSNNDVAGVSQTPASMVNSGESPQSVHRRPVGLTITVEKLDRALTDIQARIETLRRESVDLGLVRGELARMEAKWSSA
jgi:hypothetical protein